MNTAFSDIVKSALEFKIKLAIEFEVAPSTVERWASGVSTPHPNLQVLIVNYIARLREYVA